MASSYKEILKDIKALIFDYDGVLTDGTVLLTDSGQQLRTGYVRDGYALQLAVKKGLHVAVVSGGTSPGMLQRCEILGIHDVYSGVKDKVVVFKALLKKFGIEPAQLLFMGDDIPDYPVMQMAGLAVCPSDACDEIKSISAYVSPLGGGKGCVRDIITQVLKVQGLWMDEDAFTW